MNMREKYHHAIQVAKSLRMQGSADEKNGKLYFNGIVKSEDEKNKIWSAIKTVSSCRATSSRTSASRRQPRRRRRRSAAKPPRPTP